MSTTCNTRVQRENKEITTASPEPAVQRANTQERIFGSGDGTPRKAKKLTDTFRSQIFANDSKPSPPRTPKKSVPVLERNPVTGEVKMPAQVEV